MSRHRKTHCEFGHAMTPENTITTSRRDGYNQHRCRKCRDEDNEANTTIHNILSRPDPQWQPIEMTVSHRDIREYTVAHWSSMSGDT